MKFSARYRVLNTCFFVHERVSIYAALNAAFLASWPGSLFAFSLSKRAKGTGARKPVNAIGLTHTRVRV